AMAAPSGPAELISACRAGAAFACPRPTRETRPCQAASSSGSANGHPVLQAALGPELVEAARDLERALLADIALEELAVIADALDDLDREVVVEPEVGAELGALFR